MTRKQLIEQLLLRFRAVFHSVSSNIRLPKDNHDLGGAEINILMRLGRKPKSISAKDLAAELGITGGAVTQFIDKLIEKGLVERAEDPNDRRSVRISLSAKARQSRDELKQQFFNHFQTVFEGLSNQDLEQFIALLDKVKVGSKNYLNKE